MQIWKNVFFLLKKKNLVNVFHELPLPGPKTDRGRDGRRVVLLREPQERQVQQLQQAQHPTERIQTTRNRSAK